MKTSKKTYANPSFTTPMMRLILIRTERIVITKKMVLILFVALCVMVRYLVLLGDKDLIKPNKQVNIMVQDLKFNIWPTDLLFNPNAKAKQLYFRLKAGRYDFKPAKRSISLLNKPRTD